MTKNLVKPPVVDFSLLTPHQFSVEEYRAMAASGLIAEGAKLELLEGVVTKKMTIYPPHAFCVSRLNRLLSRLLEEESLRVQSPITLKTSEPEPDIAVARGPDSQYHERHPSGNDLHLVIEVADSSLKLDRDIKAAIYAAAKIPCYWVVNLTERQVEVFTEPRGGKQPGYKTRTLFLEEEKIAVIVAEKKLGTIAVREILPR